MTRDLLDQLEVPMRVALLTRRLDDKPTNGFERYAHNLYRGLRSKDLEIVLLNQRSPLPIRPSGSLVSPIYYDLILPLWRITTGKAQADVFHALTDSQALIFPWLKGKKVITMHHVDLTPPGSPPEALFRRFYGLGTKMALKYADHVICISQQTRREVMTSYGVPDEKISIIPQALSPSFRPLDRPRMGNTIGYLGALKKRKNVEFVIRAFAILQDRYPDGKNRLMICGEGPDQKRLEKIVGDLALDSVTFEGLIPEDRVVETYNSFDVFAFPSLQEGFGFPILEAQACGVPVLTREGSMVPEDVTKQAISCNNEEDMAEKIHSLLTNRAFRERVVKEGMEYASSFSVESMARKTMEVYRSLDSHG